MLPQTLLGPTRLVSCSGFGSHGWLFACPLLDDQVLLFSPHLLSQAFPSSSLPCFPGLFSCCPPFIGSLASRLWCHVPSCHVPSLAPVVFWQHFTYYPHYIPFAIEHYKSQSFCASVCKENAWKRNQSQANGGYDMWWAHKTQTKGSAPQCNELRPPVSG